VSRDSRRMPWISLISFCYIEVDFVVGSGFRGFHSLDSGFHDSDWISRISRIS